MSKDFSLPYTYFTVCLIYSSYIYGWCLFMGRPNWNAWTLNSVRWYAKFIKKKDWWFISFLKFNLFMQKQTLTWYFCWGGDWYETCGLVMWNTDIIFKHGYIMKIPIELSRKKSAYSVYVYGAHDVRLLPNKRLEDDLKNIEIWVSHGLNFYNSLIVLFFIVVYIIL